MNYKSSSSFLGLPLVHVAFAEPAAAGVKRHVAKGWIAIGDAAFGVLFAVGGVAVGGVALGGLGLGFLSVAGFSVAFLAVGGLAVGGWAVGGCALAFYSAMGGLAVAWHSALGGAAIASRFALGGAAFAQHANDAVAKEFFAKDTFYGFFKPPMKHVRWLVFLTLLPVLVGLWHLMKGRQDG